MANGILVRALPGANGKIVLAPVGDGARSKAAGAPAPPVIRLTTLELAEKAADVAEEARLLSLMRAKGIARGGFAEVAFRLQHDSRPARPVSDAPLPGSDLARIYQTTRG